MSKKRAAETMGIPRTTLIDKLSGKAPLGSTPGRSTVLTQAEEQVLVDYCKLMAQIGYPLKRLELSCEVKRVLDHDRRATPFKDNLPGKDWFNAFKKRHPDIAERTAATLGHQRAIINQQMINSWFDTLIKFLKQEVDDYENLLCDPRRFFNADESGFPLCVNTGRVLAEKGVRHVYQVANSNKQQITVMACFNACGDYCPPLIVYPGQRFRDTGIEEYPEAIYGHTESGWMDSKLFCAFLEHLDQFIENKHIPRPVLLFVDGHSTHMSLDAAQFCNDKEILLYCLLENATHVLHPCDVGFFGPLKSAWKRQVKEWQLENLGQCFTKRHFPGVFRKAWSNVSKLQNAINGFRRCGLYPIEPKNVDDSKLHPSKVHGAKSSSDEKQASPLTKNLPRQEQVSQNDDEAHTDSVELPQAAIGPEGAANNVEAPSSNTVDAMLNESAVDDVVSERGAVEVVNGSPVSSETEVEPKEPSSVNVDAQKAAKCTIIRTDSESQISQSFEILTVPEVKPKKTVNRLREKLSKALSGSDALKMMTERRLAKAAEEEAKKKRKEERDKKKKEKEEEKEKKRQLREEQTRKRQESKLLKELMAKRKKRSNSSSSSDSDRNVTFMESDDDYDESEVCPGCETEDGDKSEWVTCTKCCRKWHISCTGDAILTEIPPEQLQNYPFICENCQ